MNLKYCLSIKVLSRKGERECVKDRERERERTGCEFIPNNIVLKIHTGNTLF